MWSPPPTRLPVPLLSLLVDLVSALLGSHRAGAPPAAWVILLMGLALPLEHKLAGAWAVCVQLVTGPSPKAGTGTK